MPGGLSVVFLREERQYGMSGMTNLSSPLGRTVGFPPRHTIGLSTGVVSTGVGLGTLDTYTIPWTTYLVCSYKERKFCLFSGVECIFDSTRQDPEGDTFRTL